MGMLTLEYKYSLKDLENMIPFERDIFLDMINDKLNQGATSDAAWDNVEAFNGIT